MHSKIGGNRLVWSKLWQHRSNSLRHSNCGLRHGNCRLRYSNCGLRYSNVLGIHLPRLINYWLRNHWRLDRLNRLDRNNSRLYWYHCRLI